MVTLSGRGRDYPPTDEAGFMDFARSLRSPLLYESIKDAEPLTPIVGYRATENRRRHYEKLSRHPEGFLVIGDAACAFNPVYAQGMTTGALGAEVLDECLRKQRQRRPDGDLTGLARGFQEKLAKVNKAPWTLATGEDFRVRGVEGGTPNAVTRLMHRYIDQVLLLGTKDASVRLVLLKTFNLLKPPPALFGSAIALKVLREATRLGTEEVAATKGKIPGVA
jgi:2-polyprenyl-6-methoxyphenol hydroxylase-like FAD-dependent oxidoreductase